MWTTFWHLFFFAHALFVEFVRLFYYLFELEKKKYTLTSIASDDCECARTQRQRQQQKKKDSNLFASKEFRRKTSAFKAMRRMLFGQSIP